MINILIADDSRTEAELLKKIIQKENDMNVVACATNGKETVELANKLKPDLITMDINMPVINGLEATKLIMMSNPTPIVVISSAIKNKTLDNTFLAMEAGAVNVMPKPLNITGQEFNIYCKRMLTMLRSMAEIKVIKRRAIHKSNAAKIASPQIHHTPLLAPAQPIMPHNLKSSPYEILAIGSSVGGPQVLRNILSKLPSNYPIPIVIVQHMMFGFIDGFGDWLNSCCELNVKCVENHEYLEPGTVYIAPDKYHLKIKKSGTKLISYLYEGQPVYGFCPSISVMMHSIAEVCGKNSIGVLLTGMGSDGADGLLSMKLNNAHTIIQDQESSVVFGMANVAQSLGAVDNIIKLDNIANYLATLTCQRHHSLRANQQNDNS